MADLSNTLAGATTGNTIGQTPLANSSTPNTINTYGTAIPTYANGQLGSIGVLAPVNTSKNIEATNLNQNTNPVSVPTSKNNNQGFVEGVNAGVTASAMGNQNLNNPETAKGTPEGDKNAKEINDLMTQLGYKTADVNAQNNIINTNQANINDLQSQYAAAKTAYDVTNKQIQGQAIPSVFAQGQSALEQSVAATKLGGIAAQVQVAQGNMKAAQDTIANTIKNKYDAMESDIENKLKFYEANQDKFTPAQRKQMDSYATTLGINKNQLAIQKDQMTAATKYITDQITIGNINQSEGYKTISDMINGTISIGDAYNQLGLSNPDVSGNGGNAVVQNTMTMMGATQDMPVSQAITTLGMDKIVSAIIGQEGGSLKGVVNNPGNIKYVGQAGATDSGVKAADGGTFASFPTPQAGQDAVAKLVQKAADSGKNLTDFIAAYKGVTNTPVNSQYSDFLKDKTPQQISAFNSFSPIVQSDVKQLINGEALLSDLMSSRGITGSQARQKLLQQAQKVDPTFSENKNKIRYNYNKDWNDATTVVGKTKVSINTALNHLAETAVDSQKLNPSEWQVINKTKNWWNAQTGDPNIINLKYGLTLLATEIAAVYKGAAPTEMEIEDQKAILGDKLAKGQFSGLFDTVASRLSGKISSLNYSYKSTMGTNPPEPVINPDVRQQLVDAGIDPTKISADPNSGKTISAGGKDFQVGQVYQDANGTKWSVDASGKWTKQ